MNWCEVNQLFDRSSSGMHATPCNTMAMPPVIARFDVRMCIWAFYFTDLIFVDSQSTAKTVKIGSLENFRPYGSVIKQ